MTRRGKADVLIVGGGLGGVSAALTAARLGARVVLVEELDWLGGQLTAQGVPLDEHPWIELGVGSKSYLALRDAIREHYFRFYPVTPAARAEHPFNPGMGNVGTLCCEPKVALRVIEALLGPYESRGLLTVMRGWRALATDVVGDRITSVAFAEIASGHRQTIEARIVVDATETGDLLELAGVEHVLGGEARTDTGEPNALDVADPFDQQSATWCMALDYLPDEDHTVGKPARYAEFRELKLDCWPNRQFHWTVSDHVTHKPLERRLFAGDADEPYLFDLWHARRIAWRRNFAPGSYASDISIANWPQMDYWLRPLVGVSAEAQAEALQECRQFSLAFLYWMQTEAPRLDGGQGYRGLRPRGDVLGTADGLAKQVYFREGRRIVAEFTVLEQHVGVSARPGADAAERFHDSVGIGAYRIDLHPPTSRARDTVDIDSFPFEIPLGALIPVRTDNLIPACKNIGTTRITSGAYRVHPVEWSIGEAAGALAATCSRLNLPPRAIRADARRLEDFQQLMMDLGAPIRWPVFGALTPSTRRGYRPPITDHATAG
ncbi:FAD-dependent oxidoreductase [Bradyrhizobium sp. 190]|uniref:FAD-dependent oxidoreductase n=1 Tax=Bradyrhizobium sp. 190 TaxID=2782658 RepID=UPI001FF8A824|nr:FAD-dependent oxidoreductase [Bradyrhizobium sp. 190]MCK1517087.1 FAD-dependent oxidoreductase [Bradyrhizobium sp. 190]